MKRGMKTVFKIPVYFIFFVFLISTAGCSSSGKVKVMPAMQNKTDLKAKQHKVAIAESRTIDTFLSANALVSYDDSEELSFKIDNCQLKAVYVKKDDNIKEGQLLAELDASDLEYRLAGRQNDLKRVQLKYDKILSELDTENADRNTELESLKLDMESIGLDINQLTELIGETRLIAPFSGVITNIKGFQLGETVQAYKQFMTICKPESFILLSEILNRPGDSESSNTDLSGLVTGMKVVLIFGSKETRIEIPATITGIINTDPGILANANRSLSSPPPFRLCVKPDSEYAFKLYVDRTLTLRINTGKLENVVVLPKSAIRGFGKDFIVSVVKGEKVINRRITTGYEDNDESIVVITSGLRPGESVILD